MPEKVRQSNMELLRLVAMLLVMVLHADFATFGFPRPRLVASAPLSWFEMILTECLALCSVNVFVLITGWFGTRFRLIGLVRLLSQVVFVTFFVFETLWIVDGRLPGGWQDAFSGIYGYWFINSYLLLYLFSPVLNAYVTQVGERDFRRLILVLWAFIIPASFFYEDLNYGYSTVFFLLLYLTGRYARLYLAERLARVPTRAFLLFYFLSSCSLAVLYWVLLYAFGINPGFLVGAYSNPFHVFSALSLLFFFSRLNFTSRVVNLLAAGSLTAYLIHQQKYVRPLYFQYFRDLDSAYSAPLFAFFSALSILALYLVACLIDMVFKKLWQKVAKGGTVK